MTALEPLRDLDDLVPPKPRTNGGAGWTFVAYDRAAGMLDMQVNPGFGDTVVFYPQNNEVALIIDAETLEIVGVHIEDYDPKCLR